MTETIRLFVYGTLRTGQPLHDWLDADIVEKQDATVKGAIYPYGGGSYPIANLDDEGTIVGEVFTLNLTFNVMSCIRMEIGAGYELREVEANGIGTVYAFHCDDFMYRGPRIKSGDWLDYIEAHGQSTDDFRHGRII